MKAKARSEMKTLQILERERVKIFNKEKKQKERRENLKLNTCDDDR
jgi:hypothetical protein